MKLGSVSSHGALPGDAQAVVAKPAARVDHEIGVPEFGSGAISFLSI